MSDFAGQEYEFATGSLFGLRGWDMDGLGRLHGVTYREVWRPGENVSVCKQMRAVPCTAKAEPRDRLPKLAVEPRKRRRKGRKAQNSPYLSPLAEWERELLGMSEALEKRRCGDPTCSNGVHEVPMDHHYDPSCGCGFWAYDEAGFVPQGKVIGVIEGYGKTTIGTKGFRCEKARIVALSMLDTSDRALSRSVLARLANLYPEVGFHADTDALINEHGGVLRTWPEVDEGFWLQPVPGRPDPYTFMLSSMNTSLRNPRITMGGI